MSRGFDPVQMEAARLALQWSKSCCIPPSDTESGCSWLHGFWPIPRALGIGRVVGGHADFLARVLREHARHGSFSRVLVSGTADQAMPDLVCRAYEEEGAALELTVLDLCETPLALCRWHAARNGRSVRTICSDVLSYSAPAGFDLVLTNSFLGYFTFEQRPALFRRWAGCLRPGGKAVFTNRVREGGGTTPVAFSPAEAEQFLQEIADRLSAAGSALGIDPGTIMAGAREYVRRFEVHPVTSHEALHGQLRAAGFGSVLSDPAYAGSDEAGSSGPTTNARGIYARIVATRD